MKKKQRAVFNILVQLIYLLQLSPFVFDELIKNKPESRHLFLLIEPSQIFQYLNGQFRVIRGSTFLITWKSHSTISSTRAISWRKRTTTRTPALSVISS